MCNLLVDIVVYTLQLSTKKTKKALRESQTLHARCSNAEPKIFPPPQTLPGAQYGQNWISWRWSLCLHLQTQFGEDRCTQFRVIVVTDPHIHTHRQDRLQYTAPLSLARSTLIFLPHLFLNNEKYRYRSIEISSTAISSIGITVLLDSSNKSNASDLGVSWVLANGDAFALLCARPSVGSGTNDEKLLVVSAAAPPPVGWGGLAGDALWWVRRWCCCCCCCCCVAVYRDVTSATNIAAAATNRPRLVNGMINHSLCVLSTAVTTRVNSYSTLVSVGRDR